MMLDKLKEIRDVQCSDGNWNYDAYMHGLANGLIMAVAIMEGKEPEFLTAPKEWLADKAESAKRSKVSHDFKYTGD